MNNIPSVKIEVDIDNKLETNKSSPIANKINGNTSPNHRRRPKRSSINNNSYLSTISSVHELMSFVVSKDNPPSWLKQTDLYKEYTNKSQQINPENLSSSIPSPHYHQQLHRKQRSNLQMYARSRQSWQSLTSPPLINLSIDNHSNESIHKIKHETTISSINSSLSSSSSSMNDLSIPLNISIKSESIEQNSSLVSNKSKSLKQPTSTITTRRQHMLCKKKIPQNGIRRHQHVNSVEDQESLEKKDSSSSSEHDSNTSTSSSSIEHTSPSPTTTVSGTSSHHSSPTEYMRGNSSINTRLSSPLRIQTSISPHIQTLSTPQRRSTRIWAPSNFYINPMWILPTVVSSKRLLVQNTSSSPSPSSESNKRPRRRCRS
ncbi:unnamed protein product [Rotaria sp. Silwood2]|nr:unnamed protein product [Rotaria sp. Silwood2]CAF2647414.1 unnamed protein product [Rotaria sp. Silwood2]CAF2867048.1 unnamed protein product [Rotaria sp. Silwood2]CAF3040782.1 unnamed protein product [Rotaria sp. Silwood2]